MPQSYCKWNLFPLQHIRRHRIHVENWMNANRYIVAKCIWFKCNLCMYNLDSILASIAFHRFQHNHLELDWFRSYEGGKYNKWGKINRNYKASGWARKHSHMAVVSNDRYTWPNNAICNVFCLSEWNGTKMERDVWARASRAAGIRLSACTKSHVQRSGTLYIYIPMRVCEDKRRETSCCRTENILTHFA